MHYHFSVFIRIEGIILSIALDHPARLRDDDAIVRNVLDYHGARSDPYVVSDDDFPYYLRAGSDIAILAYHRASVPWGIL